MAKRTGARRRGAGRKLSRRAAGTAARRRTDGTQRRDDEGVLWTRAQVAAAVRTIVAELARVPPARVLLATRFHDDLDWDEWFVLAVSKPIERRLHEQLSDGVLLQLSTVGDLVNYVWARMEVLP